MPLFMDHHSVLAWRHRPHVYRRYALRGTGPDDASWWVDLLDSRFYAQAVRLPAEDRSHCQGPLDRRGVDVRQPLRPGGNVGVQAPDALKRCVNEDLVTGEDRCVLVDVHSLYLILPVVCVLLTQTSHELYPPTHWVSLS